MREEGRGGTDRQREGGGRIGVVRQVDWLSHIPVVEIYSGSGSWNRPGAAAKLQSSTAFLCCKHRLAAGAALSARCCLLTNDFLWRAQREREADGIFSVWGHRVELSVFLLLENVAAKSRDGEFVCLCACLGVCLPVSVVCFSNVG